ncbi:class I SAM-dependent methyltransferase [Sporosarcina cyprini]|uniref:class I SAM-dependent methyltransferase n=1 Tax=Sporosarcina cyprini TaxID=2910523 RepID=UPI001EE0C9C9|nr:class I SAM-dependent methyltransferase [Sporosarcina cyprini]MCG3088878.1 class I SAM-dependent methyltransferase [Sporosarcina cyprini]
MNEIVTYYNQFDEWGRLEREPIEFRVNWHFIKKYLPPSGSILDNGAGPGKYAMELAKGGYQVTLTDLTPKLVQIAREKAAELDLVSQFEAFHEADARNLAMLEDEQFEASLMLGPMYHLQNELDRIKAIQELHRVTKRNGIVCVAFMPRIRHLLTSLIHPEHWKPNDNMNTITQFDETGCFNHAEEGRFTGAYYFNVKDINPFMEKNGFESLELIGSNIGAILPPASWTYWKEKGEDEVEKVFEFIRERATDSSILGISSHLLYVGRRK